MFTKNSRYYKLKTISGTVDGRKVLAVKLRRLPTTSGAALAIKDSDQLDVMSEQQYRDATRVWHIGDANTELEVGKLVQTTGRIILVPEK
jgi:hypothetical protein